MILVLLQNAWAKDERSAFAFQWCKDVWRMATMRSRTGQRLTHMLGPEFFDREDVELGECTDEVAVGNSGGKCKPKPDFVRGLIWMVRPSVIVACGQPALATCMQIGWPKSLIAVPHPAHRLLTNALYVRARDYIVEAHAAHADEVYFKPHQPMWLQLTQQQNAIAIRPLPFPKEFTIPQRT